MCIQKLPYQHQLHTSPGDHRHHRAISCHCHKPTNAYCLNCLTARTGEDHASPIIAVRPYFVNVPRPAVGSYGGAYTFLRSGPCPAPDIRSHSGTFVRRYYHRHPATSGHRYPAIDGLPGTAHPKESRLYHRGNIDGAKKHRSLCQEH